MMSADINDRGRRRKKRIGPFGNDREEDSEPPHPGRTMIILSKPHTDRPASATPEGAQLSPRSPTRATEIKQPTVLLKTRDGSERDGSRATSPASLQTSGASGSSQSGSKDEGFHQSSEQKLAPPAEMPMPVKLIDESLQWCDNAMEYLQDHSDFYVVGIIGLQGVGKSTILSIIGGQLGEGTARSLFKQQTREMREMGEHCTIGIDMFVTAERMILLDTQPVLSASVMDRMTQYEKKVLTTADYYSTENALHMQSLQIAAFLMAVCHTVIIAQDWFADPHFLRFVQTAEMLKPGTPTTSLEMSSSSEDSQEYYPHIVFIQNKCQLSDFLPPAMKEMRDVLKCLFAKSKLKHKGSIFQELLPRREKDSKEPDVNLFLLPERNPSDQAFASLDEVPAFQGHPGFDHLSKLLTCQILAMPRSNLTHTSLTEKNWFHYAARIWETVKKSNLFLEYSRLLP